MPTQLSKFSRTRTVTLFAGVILAFTATQAGADWTQWRGSNRDGSVTGFKVPAEFPKQLTEKWKIDVGTGYASPLVVGDAIYLQTRQGDEEMVQRLDLATGKQLWQQQYAAPYEMNTYAKAHGKGPKSTPVYSDGFLYTLSINGLLACFDAKSGKVLWAHDATKEHKITAPDFGTAMSPLVEGGLLIAHLGGHDDGALTALDAKTGNVRWRWTGDGPAYASPVIATLGGVRQVVTQTQKLCVGLDFATGQLLWSLPFTTAYDQNTVSPVVVDQTVIFAGTKKSTFAVRVTRQGDKWSADQLWETKEATMYMSTPILSGKLLYGLSELHSGQLFSLDPATGKVEWTAGSRMGTYASLFDAGPVIFVLTTDADLCVYAKDGLGLKEITRYKVSDGPTWTSPVFIGNQVLIKDATRLILYEFKTGQ